VRPALRFLSDGTDPPGIHPPPADFALAAAFAGAFGALREVLEASVYAAVVSRALGAKGGPSIPRGRVEGKLRHSLFNLTQYSILSAISLAALRGQSWVTDSRALWEGCRGLPCRAPRAPALRLAYAAEAGHYAYGVAALLLGRDRRLSDSGVLVAHHVVTLLLLGASHAWNYLRVGVLTAGLHDVCDVFLDGAKVVKALGYPPDAPFVAFLVVWTATRLGYFPFYVLRSVLLEAWGAVLGDHPGEGELAAARVHYYAASGLLLTLLGMHLYWTYLIVRVVARSLARRGIDDVRDPDSSDDEGAGVGAGVRGGTRGPG